jgi:hypothetical protein
MRKLLIILILILFSIGIKAQDRPFSGLKGDYKQVQIVARVKIKSIKYAAPDVYPLYVVQSEIIESYKGKIKRGQTLEFYLHIEDGENRDLNKYLGNWIVFLKGRYPIPKGGKGWYELENSRINASNKTVSQMRRIKLSSRRS